jgi:DNA-binding CsgD family transcriptional regulator
MVADMESYRMSPREFEIYSLLIQGKKPSAIARMLGCSPATVKAHKRSIYRKCGVSSDCGLLRFAFDNGDARCLGAFNQE